MYAWVSAGDTENMDWWYIDPDIICIWINIVNLKHSINVHLISAGN